MKCLQTYIEAASW